MRRNSSDHSFCPPFVSQRANVGISIKQPNAGVVCDYDGIPGYEIAQRSLFDQLATGNPVKIDLLEAACMAARNSKLAELIDAERHALNCRASDHRGYAIDIILEGESLEQRNKEAGKAAELFLGLVQVQLQRELIKESRLQFARFRESIQAAESAGFATADGKNELAEGEIRLKQSESALKSSEQKLMYQLNLLIHLEPDRLLILHPVHEITLTEPDIDVRKQTDIAQSSRPGIQAIETVMAQGTEIDSIYRLLNQFDARLGIQLPSGPGNKLLLRHQIEEFLKQANEVDITSETRVGQVQQILDARKQGARLDASQAMLRLQSSFERLALFNEDIARLKSKGQQLKAKQELYALDSTIQSNRNWVELQQVRSERVDAAIEHETAKINLLQAQGILVNQCGYHRSDSLGSCQAGCQSQ